MEGKNDITHCPVHSIGLVHRLPSALYRPTQQNCNHKAASLFKKTQELIIVNFNVIIKSQIMLQD